MVGLLRETSLQAVLQSSPVGCPGARRVPPRLAPRENLMRTVNYDG